MDRNELSVVIENDDLKEPAGSVGTDVEIAIALAHNADGVADCVLDVLVVNTVLAGVVGDLHLCRLSCLQSRCKLPCGVRNGTRGVVVRTAVEA